MQFDAVGNAPELPGEEEPNINNERRSQGPVWLSALLPSLPPVT